MNTMKEKGYWTRERMAAACEKMGREKLAAAVRDKNICIQACRNCLLVAVKRGEDGEWLYEMNTSSRTVRNLQTKQEEYMQSAERSKAMKRLEGAKGRVYGSLYVYNDIGSGKWTRKGSKSILAATGWAELVGGWLCVYNGRGKTAELLKRVKVNGGSFSHFELNH